MAVVACGGSEIKLHLAPLATISEDYSTYASWSETSSPINATAETLLLIDWDDTLLPTTWLGRQGFMDETGLVGEIRVSKEQQSLLQELETRVEQTLLAAMQHGRVVIVTNAMDGWVEASCCAFMPGLLPLLDDLDIVSARSTYEPYSGACPTEWKKLAFMDIIDVAFEEIGACQRRNILSIGDSMYEHAALAAATNGMPCCHSKTVKLMERPEIQQLTEEHRLLGENLLFAVAHEDSLDLEVAAEMLYVSEEQGAAA